jgi:hypothetical protein
MTVVLAGLAAVVITIQAVAASSLPPSSQQIDKVIQSGSLLSPVIQTTTVPISQDVSAPIVLEAALSFEPADRMVQLRLSADGTIYRGSLMLGNAFTVAQVITNVRWANVTDLNAVDFNAPPINAAEIAISPSSVLTLTAGELRQFLITAPKPSLPGLYRGRALVAVGDQLLSAGTPITIELDAPFPTLNFDTHSPLLVADANGSYRASFNLWAGATTITKLAFTPGHLVSADPAAIITATLLTFQPTTAAFDVGDAPTLFSITLPPLVGAGNYSGTLLITYYGNSAVKARGIETLTLLLKADPLASVALSLTDKLQFAAEVGTQFTPTLYLQETSGVNAARSVTLSLDSLLDSVHQRYLSDQILRATEAVTIPRGQTLRMPLPLSLASAAPGSYTGTLQLVGSTLNPTYLPFEITIKAGLGWPLFWLIVGILLGFYLTHYNDVWHARDRQLIVIDLEKQKLEAQNPKDNNKPPTAFFKFYGPGLLDHLANARQLVEVDLTGNKTQIDDILKFVRGRSAVWAKEESIFKEQQAVIAQWLQAHTEATDYALPGAVREQLQAIDAKRHTYNTSADLKAAVDKALADWLVFNALVERIKQLAPKLKAVIATLESAAASSHLNTFTTLSTNLKMARSIEDVTALNGQVTALESALLASYQEYKQFYYDACSADAYKWIALNDGLTLPPAHWPTVKSKLALVLAEINNYLQTRQKFQMAGDLTYKVWRVAWFYQYALRPIFEAVPQAAAKTPEWTAVLNKANEVETWLSTTNYHESTLTDFDGQLLGDAKLATLYQLLSTAQGKIISSPLPLPKPEKPPREGLELALDESAYSVPKTPGLISSIQPFGLMQLDGIVSSLNAIPGLSALTPKSGRDQQVEGEEPSAQQLSFGNLVRAIVKLVSNPWLRWSIAELVITSLSIFFLAMVGLQTLWAGNATFGANPFDYPSLFLWGLGSNATAAGVSQLVTGWGFKAMIKG